MVKKIVTMGVLIMMICSLAACGHPVDSCNSLEEMQKVLPNDIYYFRFQHEGVKEAGKYEATKKKWRSEDTEYTYFRYSIWYDVEYSFGGQTQKRKMRVIGTDHTHPMSFSTLVLNTSSYTVDIERDNYWYYFVLDNKRGSLTEEEIEHLLSICELAIQNKYMVK